MVHILPQGGLEKTSAYKSIHFVITKVSAQIGGVGFKQNESDQIVIRWENTGHVVVINKFVMHLVAYCKIYRSGGYTWQPVFETGNPLNVPANSCELYQAEKIHPSMKCRKREIARKQYYKQSPLPWQMA